MIYILRNVLGKRGIQLRRIVSVSLRGNIIHPLDAAYSINYTTGYPTILMEVPVSKCRTQIWNTLEEHKNPFVKTITDYSKYKISDYDSSAIKAYYENYMPENAGEVLRLNDNEALKKIPAYGYILPWDTKSVSELIKTRERVVHNENKLEGKSIGITSGYTDFGPVNAEKGAIEFTRLVKIFEKIKTRGYTEKHFLHDGGIRGYFLTGNDNDWCFIIKSGKHRAYALSALGYKNIPVVIDYNIATIKQINNLHFWPQVKSGFFSKDEAYAIANNILEVEKQI